ncbi:hypothetical protein HYFRA_00012557 [Hymenoscyphus fraxineus]|uniref:Uncharacterized protein n=1 Tax=Hymenoscyphus fraxineus TaxID=746836 RepID=A0A9N9L2V6_9HELO|nr:hypothetical protein HYFRA_00012557 [Hymenoscyphus fraxineus]
MESTESLTQCRALNVSDEKQCGEKATSVNGHFCSFHSKQCQALYRGYKTRNARLEKLDANPPPYLAETKIPLVNQTFADVETKEVCQELHDHLFLKFQLLDRVIRARKLHHSRFFSMDMDYGHERYLSSLQVQKATVTKALERLERRTAEVLYASELWFKWIRECQNSEEENREKEQKKVKQEAALWKRHWKATQERMRVFREKEDKLRQDNFLEAVYKERLAEKEDAGEDSGEDWDPIEEVLEDSRGNFIDLIKHFLWIESPIDVNEKNKAADNEETSTSSEVQAPSPAKTATPKKKTAGKSKAVEEKTPDKSLIETKDQMVERLRVGSEIDWQITQPMLVGSIQRPVLTKKTVTFSEDEITHLTREINDIKQLLFCRILLGHATLLPAALRANSIEEFLADEEVTGSALRDICLKMESPGLQEIRDACADLFRAEEEEDTPMPDAEAGSEDEDDEYNFKFRKQRGEMPDKWLSKREKAKAEKSAQAKVRGMPDMEQILGDIGSTAVDFGDLNKKATSQKKIKVKICGRTIWNYPSNKALSRGGWLQFCIIAKDSKLQDVIALCRNWDEFFELNILALWSYFPGQHWIEWVGGQPRQQMLQLGFITYYETIHPDAEMLTQKYQTGSRQRNVQRAHAAFEARNVICAHIKRDQVSRRLIQYLSMEAHQLLILVRDAETGNILVKPPEEERWIHRTKSGVGRASKNEWKVVTSVGPRFFEQMDRHRDWHFDFNEYYDVYVWDVDPGQPFPALYNVVQSYLYKAHRCKIGMDVYNPEKAILQTLCREEESNRVRDLRPEDKGMQSIWDHMMDQRTRFFYGEVPDLQKHYDEMEKKRETDENALLPDNMFPKHLFYNEADAAEDAILFPEELDSNTLPSTQIAKVNPIDTWMKQGFSMSQFVQGLDSVDSDADDEDDEEGSEESDHDEDDDYVIDGPRDDAIPSDPSSVSATLMSMVPENHRDVMAKILKQPRDTRHWSDPDRMNDDFMCFIDREKAKIFKEVWHKADTEPHAHERYIEMRSMAKKSLSFLMKTPVGEDNDRFIAMKLVADMNVSAEDMGDVRKALAKVLPFFTKDFLDSESGLPFRDSLLFKQEERAKTIPDCRTHVSNKHRKAEFWKPFDDAIDKLEDTDDLGSFPDEWDVTVRPIIASLYKSGILRNRPDAYYEGQAFCAIESSRPNKPEFFIDFRQNMPSNKDLSHMEDPSKVKPFMEHAAGFVKKIAKEGKGEEGNIRFSVLKMWSHAYFYPLMIGPDNHDMTSFRDLKGRRWIWQFVPKDMAGSEYSMHYTAKSRFAPYDRGPDSTSSFSYTGSSGYGGVAGLERYRNRMGAGGGRGGMGRGEGGSGGVNFFKGSVVVKRDKVLVMARNEEECKVLTAAAAFAIECRPWRQEVDLWKSFLNVDYSFLEGLEKEWFE